MVDALLKSLGPSAVVVVLLGGVVFYLWRVHEKTLLAHISYLEKELAREQGSNNTMRDETNKFLERTGEERARDRHQVSEMVSIMRDAIVDEREARRQYVSALDAERRETLAHIDHGMETIVSTLLSMRVNA